MKHLIAFRINVSRLLRGAAIAIVCLLLLASPALAIADPDTGPNILAVDAYQYCLEPGDMLFIVEYQISYAVLPTETIAEAFIGRVLDGGVEVPGGHTSPYAYYNKGYDTAIFAIYFSSGTAPTWSGVESVGIIGNPTIGWGGVVPSSYTSTISWHTSATNALTQILVGSKVLGYASSLGNLWSLTLSQTTTAGTSVLTSYGQQYFTTAVPFLPQIAPNIYPASIIAPTYTDKAPGPLSYLDVLLHRWDPYIDPYFIGWADWTGFNLGTVKAAAWCLPILIIGWFMSKGIGDPRPIPGLLLFAVPFGALVGMLTPVIAIVLAFVSALLFGILFAWGRSSS
jgi:hypothetical protein